MINKVECLVCRQQFRDEDLMTARAARDAHVAEEHGEG